MQILIDWTNGNLSFKTDCPDYVILYGMLEGAKELISLNVGATGREIKKGKSDIVIAPSGTLPKLTRD